MTYPDTIPGVRDALDVFAYSASALGTEAQAALIEAAGHGSIVEKCHATIAVLAPLANSLSNDGNALLAGCTKLCTQNGWAARGGLNYAALFAAAVAALPAVPEPEGEEA